MQGQISVTQRVQLKNLGETADILTKAKGKGKGKATLFNEGNKWQ